MYVFVVLHQRGFFLWEALGCSRAGEILKTVTFQACGGSEKRQRAAAEVDVGMK